MICYDMFGEICLAFPRKQMTEDDIYTLMGRMGQEWRDEFLETSYEEICGFITFVERGGDRLLWREMSEKRRQCYVLCDDLQDFLAKAELRGWNLHEFCIDASRQHTVPEWQKMPHFWTEFRHEVRSMIVSDKPNVQSSRLRKFLLDPYPCMAIPRDQLLHIGHLLHGMVELCQIFCGVDKWPQHVCVVDDTWDQEKVLVHITSQTNVRLVLLILTTSSHWALGAIDFYSKGMVVYDGKGLEVIMDKAKNFRDMITTTKRPVRGVHRADVPEQTDDWSCGHRLLLAVDIILLNCFFEPYDDSGLPLQLDPNFASSEEIQSLSKLLYAPVENLEEGQQEKRRRDMGSENNDRDNKRQRVEASATASATGVPAAASSAQSNLEPHRELQHGVASAPSASPAVSHPEPQGELQHGVASPAVSHPEPHGELQHGVASPAVSHPEPHAEQHAEAPEASEGPAESTPKKQVRKRPIQPVSDSPAEPVKKKPMKKRDIRARVKQLIKDLEQKNITHNGRFQKVHAQNKDAINEKGHWQQFLDLLATDQQVTCPACIVLTQEFLQEMKEPAEPAGDQVDAPAFGRQDVPSPCGLNPRKRGRPPATALKKGNYLWNWMRQNRAGVYQPIGETPEEIQKTQNEFIYFCIPCQKEVQFRRDALTFVHSHESTCKGHTRGLEILGLSLTGQINAERKACQGVIVDNGGYPLTDLLCSLRLWISAGQPGIVGCKTTKKQVLEDACWKVIENGQITLRHKSCESSLSAAACSTCLNLAHNTFLAQEIAAWGYEVDLAALAQLAAYSSDQEVRDHVQLMRSRDYFQKNLAGSDLDNLLAMQASAMILQIKRSFESVAKVRRNSSFDIFCNTRLRGLNDCCTGDMQKHVFADLLRKYKTALTSNSVMKEAWTGLDFIVFQCFSMFFKRLVWIGHVWNTNTMVKQC